MPESSAASSPKTQWTDAQLRGIKTTGASLLVSAAAGSGKTAMLSARCAHLVCDPAEHCDVDELLVVTFTEASAAQMKSRIHAALRDRCAADDNPRLRRQLVLVDRASVSTLHGFCVRILREHFHPVGLDPAFTVLDGDEAKLMRQEVARDLFDSRYATDAAGDFHRFIDAYGEGNDARLIERVIHTYEMLRSLVDPADWISRSLGRIEVASDSPLEQTELGRELIDTISHGLVGTRELCLRAIQQLETLKQFPQYLAALQECLQILRFWERTLAEDGLDALAEQVGSLELPRLAAVRNTVPGKESAKAAVDAVREQMKSSSWKDLLRFTAGQWEQGLAATLPHAKVFLKLVEDLGEQYRLAKEALRVVDFSDLEQLSLRVLCDGPVSDLRPSPAALAYHKRFKHVLVDEYQDINAVQDAILSLLSRECLADDPSATGNLFCVGDVKQSIYRFRLAEAARFLQRQKLFQSPGPQCRGQVIDLQSNFRSRGPLLEAINEVFRRLMTASAVDIEYDQSHHLRPGLDYPIGNGCFTGRPIEMHLLPEDLTGDDPHETSDDADDAELDRTEREAVLVSRRIRQLMGMDGSPRAAVMEKDAAGAMRPRPLAFGDIAILLRSIRHKSEQYANVLRRAGIPVHSQSSAGYFQSAEIRDMLALLSILDNQRQDIPLAAVLRSPLANLKEAEDLLARVRLAYAAEGEDSVAFHDAVVRYAAEQEGPAATALKEFLVQLERWRELAHRRPLAELIHTIYQQTGYLAYCAGLHEGDQRVANLMDLHHRAGHFGSFHRQGLSRFMHFLQSLNDEADLGQPSIASEADDVVRVMTIHRSKGLEFPVVIVPDLGKRINVKDCYGSILVDRQAGLGLAVVEPERMIRYPSLALALVRNRLRQQALAEEMRVLYVAMTRAREHLILVATAKSGMPQRWAGKWAGHEGAFPDDMILGASTSLDWLGPALAAEVKDPFIAVVEHSADEVSSWRTQHARRKTLSPQQAELAALAPIAPPPAVHPDAQAAIERLEFAYPFIQMTRLAAAESVTLRGKQSDSPVHIASAKLVDRTLPRPRFLSEQALSPTDIGSATHLVLRHLDWSRTDDLAAQIDDMIVRKLITPRQAAAVNLGALDWLAASEIGALMKENHRRLWREAPIVFAADPPPDRPGDDPLDRAMIRGRIDALVQTTAGAVLIDYKTDAVSPETVRFRAADYAGQMEQYRQAVEKLTARSVREAYLVFLTPRVIWRL